MFLEPTSRNRASVGHHRVRLSIHALFTGVMLPQQYFDIRCRIPGMLEQVLPVLFWQYCHAFGEMEAHLLDVEVGLDWAVVYSQSLPSFEREILEHSFR